MPPIVAGAVLVPDLFFPPFVGNIRAALDSGVRAVDSDKSAALTASAPVLAPKQIALIALNKGGEGGEDEDGSSLLIAKRASRVGVGTVASASAAVVRGDCRGEVAAADAYAAATVVSTVTIAESDITFVAVF